MITASFSTKAFFSAQQMHDIATVMQRMSGVGIIIESFYRLERLTHGGRVEPTDEQYRSFMGLARLWRVVDNIISIAFIDKLIAHRLVLKDRQGNEYCLQLTKQRGEPWFPPPDLMDDENEGRQGGAF